MSKSQNVLIAGGSGYIGQRLSALLIEKGYTVNILSRNRSKGKYWDPVNEQIDKDVISAADHIINLAGANVGSKRWNNKRKELIRTSRTRANEFLYKCIFDSGHQPTSFVSASAIGFYGHSDQKPFVETDPPAKDYLGEVGEEWEASSNLMASLNIRTVILRTGIVFSAQSEALKKMKLPLYFGLSPLPSNGQQVLPWIHLDDLCAIYINAIEDFELEGIYNAVAPSINTNKEIMSALGSALGKKSISLPTPKFLLNLALGELADYIFYSVPVSADKIVSAGFKFKYPDLKNAFEQIYKS